MNDETLKAAFDAGYKDGYHNGGNDAVNHEWGSVTGVKARAKERQEAWEYYASDLPKADSKPRLRLIRKFDYIKSNWSHWRAERDNPDGTITHGFVEATSNGETLAHETFEEEQE